MSLVKTLQNRLSSASTPWTPAGKSFAVRLINEILLGEESDLLPNGQPTSHFELYLAAMTEVGASLKVKSFSERHIEIDSGEHEQASRQLLIELCGNDSNNWHKAKIAAVAALESRLDLWDAIAETIEEEGEKLTVSAA